MIADKGQHLNSPKVTAGSAAAECGAQRSPRDMAGTLQDAAAGGGAVRCRCTHRKSRNTGRLWGQLAIHHPGTWHIGPIDETGQTPTTPTTMSNNNKQQFTAGTDGHAWEQTLRFHPSPFHPRLCLCLASPRLAWPGPPKRPRALALLPRISVNPIHTLPIQNKERGVALSLTSSILQPTTPTPEHRLIDHTPSPGLACVMQKEGWGLCSLLCRLPACLPTLHPE